MGRKFVKNYLTWRKKDPAANSVSDADLIIACCRALKLDLVCIQPQALTAGGPALLGDLTDIPRLTAEGLFVFWVVDGSFQKATAQQGTLQLLADMAASPDAVGRKLQQHASRVMADLARGVSAGAQGVIIADDIAYRQNTYMSPDFVRQHLLPVWQTQAAAARELGVPVFFHSDGNLNAVLPIIAEAGFDGLQGIEPAAGMNLGAVRARYGKTLCLMGNIDPALLSEQGSRIEAQPGHARLRRAVLDLTASAGGDGGLIFGTSSGLHAGMSPGLVQYMYDLASDPDTAIPATSH